MTSMRISYGKGGTSIRIKAGKGQSLNDLVAAMAGEKSTERWVSHAQWPLNVYHGMDGTGISTDTHRTEDEAKAVCAGLQREGFGGQRRHFPIKTWVTRSET